MPWLMGGLLFFLTAGFAKLASAVLNRMLAIPQPKSHIAVKEIIQLTMVPLYAALLFRGALEDRFRNFLDLDSSDFTTHFLRCLVAVGFIGFLELIRSTIAYQRYRHPDCQIEIDSAIIDFRQPDSDQPWQQSLVGYGVFRWMALLPGNEQFTLEVNTKTFALPRLPSQWDGLSIVHFADSHFYGPVTRKYFELVCEQAAALKPDLFVFTGDLLDDLLLLEWLPETFGRLRAPLGQYFILGNHDSYQDVVSIRQEFIRNGWVDLAGRTLELDSLTAGPSILLAGDETPWLGEHPDLSEVSDHQFRILLSHTPDNINWARNQGFDLVLAGHTHGGQIRLPVLGPVYSPSRFGCKFASGDFWLDPTLMCVSRGLSGREPIRYLCAPELTKLVLKTHLG